MPTATATATATVTVSEYAELKRLVESTGLMARQPRYYIGKFALTLSLLAVGLVGLHFAAEHPLWWALDVVMLAIAFVQVAQLGHDVVHGQVRKSGRFSMALSLLVGNLLVGVSRSWWNENHSAHHAHPNDLVADPNVDILFIACTPEQAVGRPGWVRWILRHQAPLLFPIFALEFFSMHQQSLAHVLRGTTGLLRLEACLLLAHYILYTGALLLAFGPLGAIGFAIVHHLLTGVYMASIFAPNHKGMPLSTSLDHMGFLREQVLTARNVRGGGWVDFVYGGLNWQIEHHLFPTMARNNLRRVSPLVRGFCAARGVEYSETDFMGAWRDIMGHLTTVSRAVAATA